MARFDRQIATANKLIQKNGQLVVWKSVTTGAPADAAMPWKPTVAVDPQHDAYICFLPINRQMTQLFNYLRGTNDIPTGSVMGLMAGNVAFAPKLKDVVMRDGDTLRIKSIDLLSPNGQKILYTIEFEA